MEKKKNIFVRFFSCIGRGIKNFFLYLGFSLLYIIVNPFVKSKVRGKKNVRKDDEARVFVANHYEIFGPVAMYLRFPYKFRPWVIDKIMTPESVEAQMSISVYNNFPKYPMWFKKIVVKSLKNMMVFAMNHAKAIKVSRENFRENLITMQESMDTLNKGVSVLIFPELSYTESGVGVFQSGFEHLGKYYYQKTGKKISFYPVFISKQEKQMFIEKPIVYDPNKDPNEQKHEIVYYLRDKMLDCYLKSDCSAVNKKAKPIKAKRK